MLKVPCRQWIGLTRDLWG